MGSCACPGVFASVHLLVDAVYNLQLTMTQTPAQLHSVSKSNLYLYLYVFVQSNLHLHICCVMHCTISN